jgi:hypothetical protein
MRSIVLAGLGAAALGCAAGPDPDGVRVDGRVWRGPIAPVCAEGTPCDAPFAGEFSVERGNRLVARFSSASDGRYVVWLAPGTYQVRPVSPAVGFPGQAQDLMVRSPATTADLRFDTGIR